MHHFTFSRAKIEGLSRGGGGVIPKYCKRHNFWNFTDFSLGYIEEKVVIDKGFFSNVYEFLHNYSKNIIIMHDNCYFAILGENVVFEQKQFHLSKPLVFYRIKSNGYRKQYLKFELDPIIFLDFTDIWSLKYKEIRGSGAKLLLRSIWKSC